LGVDLGEQVINGAHHLFRFNCQQSSFGVRVAGVIALA
jgi:hypothetical protein